MVEALNQSCTSEGLRDDLGRRLTSEFLKGHAVGIGHIDDGLALPSGQRLRDIPVRLVTDSQKDDVRLDGFRQFFGNDFGSDRGRSGSKAFRVASGCNGYFDAAAGKRLSKSLADVAEADNCVAHIVSFGLPRPTGSEYRTERPAGRGGADLGQAAVDGDLAGGHEAAVLRREKGSHRSDLRGISHALERIERGEYLHPFLA